MDSLLWAQSRPKRLHGPQRKETSRWQNFPKFRQGGYWPGPQIGMEIGLHPLTTPHPRPRLGRAWCRLSVIFWVLKEGSGSSTGDVPGWMPSLDSGRSDAQSSCLWTAEQPQAWVACSRSDTRRDLHRSWVRSPQGQQVLLKEFGDCGRCPFIFLTSQAKGLLKLSLVVKRTLSREGK